MKDKIFQLIDKMSCPYLVIDKNNQIVHLNKHFKETFLKKYCIDFSTINEFEADWEVFRSLSELAIINKHTSFMLLGDFLSEFIEYENNNDETYRIYNFSNSLIKTSGILIKVQGKLDKSEIYNFGGQIVNNNANIYHEIEN